MLSVNVLDRLERKLREHPVIPFIREDESIRVLPQDEEGFEVLLTAHEQGCTVSFNGWHDEFDDAAKAIDYFGLGLSESCRLIEFRRGSHAVKWRLEIVQDGEWTDSGTVGLILVPFWRRSNRVILQNHFLPSEEPDARS